LVTELPNASRAPLPLAEVVPLSSPMASAWGATTADAPTTEAATVAVAIAFFGISLFLRLSPLRRRDHVTATGQQMSREWLRRFTR
jgi:hypothetical protein